MWLHFRVDLLPEGSWYVEKKTGSHHYENTPLFKYIENFTTKNWNFSDKNSDIFHISAQNIDCGYSLESPCRGGSNGYHNLCFWAEIRKIMYTPVNPSFTIQKWGFRGSKLYRRVFVMKSFLPYIKWQTIHQVYCPFKGSIFLKNRLFIIQEKFYKLIYDIDVIIKCGIRQPVKFHLVSFLNWIKMTSRKHTNIILTLCNPTFI